MLLQCVQAVMRCIVGYFMDLPKEEVPYIKVPLHTIIKLTPTAHSELMHSVSLELGVELTFLYY